MGLLSREKIAALYQELIRSRAEIERWPEWLKVMRERRLRYQAFILARAEETNEPNESNEPAQETGKPTEGDDGKV
jgi:hypothetical protein